MTTATQQATGTFAVQSWDEGPYAEVEGAPKLTQARVTSTYQGGVATTTWTVAPGSGTGELAGLRGEGGHTAGSNRSEVPYRLEYRLE